MEKGIQKVGIYQNLGKDYLSIYISLQVVYMFPFSGHYWTVILTSPVFLLSMCIYLW